MGEILVGTASWTDRTLLQSGWYPPDVTTPEERLRYYASRFPVVEVDSTYYALPAEQTARLWARRTPPRFTFDVKAFSLLTCPGDAAGTHVLMNNCYRDYAQTNARQLADVLKGMPACPVRPAPGQWPRETSE